MYSHPLVVALRDHLASSIASLPLSNDEHLHELVGDVVDDLKAAGWPPERVIVAVKQVAEDVGLVASRTSVNAAVPLSSEDATVVAMVRWSIDRYYATDAPPN